MAGGGEEAGWVIGVWLGWGGVGWGGRGLLRSIGCEALAVGGYVTFCD